MTELPIRVVSETATTITLGWSPPAGQEGYVLLIDGQPKSNDGKRHASIAVTAKQATMGKMPGETNPASKHTYGVRILGAQAEGTYPTSVTPPPPTSAVYDWDGRASAFTSLPNPGPGDSVPPGLGGIYVSDDLKIITDPSGRFSKVYRVRLNVNSKNPWWVGETPNSAEIVLVPKRPLALGQIFWLAQSIKIDSYLDGGNSWTAFDQHMYPTLTSPPGCDLIWGSHHWANPTGKPALGLDHRAGVIQTVGQQPQPYMKQTVARPVSEILGKWCDIIVGYKVALDNTGFLVYATRLHGEGGWTVHENSQGIPTAQKIESEPLPLRDVMDKQGGYQSEPSPSWPAGWTQTYLLRGLSRHPTRADAEASLT
jgi:hypothetical protein